MSIVSKAAWLERFLRNALEKSGAVLAWLPLAFILVQFAVVLMVFVFAAETTKARESLFYINALMIFGGAGYTLLADEHVRVDLFYQKFSDRVRALVALLGSLVFLVPFLIFLWIESWPIARFSWITSQSSQETGGLGLVFLLKSMPLLFVISLGLASLHLIVRSLLTLWCHNQGND